MASAKGKVSRIAPRPIGCNIQLADIAPSPKDGVFRLEGSHENYNAIFSLALTAAVNGYDLLIGTLDDFDPNEIAKINNVRVEWDRG